MIVDVNQQRIENGAATEMIAGSGYWRYTATQTVPDGTVVTITVTATDRPGNSGVKTTTK